MKGLLFCSFLLMCSILWSQERNFVWEHNFAWNYQIRNWDLNTSLGSRTTWEETLEESSRSLEFLEINQFVTRKVAANKKLSAGYKYRSVDPSEAERQYEHRITQQLAWTHLHQRVRLLSRFRAEQRIRSTSFEHRYRYRFSADMPLSGEKLNVGEFYALASSELLLASEEGERSWDHRMTVGLGMLISSIAKVQAEFTYRSEDLTRELENIPFFTSSLIFNLKN